MATHFVQADAILDASSLSPLDAKLYGNRRAKAFLRMAAGRGRGHTASAFLSTEDGDDSFYTSLGGSAKGLEGSFYVPFGTSHGAEKTLSCKPAGEPESSPLGSSLRSVRRVRAWAQLPEETAVLGQDFLMVTRQDQDAQADDRQDQLQTEVQQGEEPAPVGLSQSALDALATSCDEDDGLGGCTSARLLQLKRLKAFGHETQVQARAAVFKEEDQQAEAALLEGLSTTGSSCSSGLPQSMLDRHCTDEDTEEEDQDNEEEDSLLLRSRRAHSFNKALGEMLPQALTSADTSLAKGSATAPMLNLTADCEFSVSYRGPSSPTHGGA